MIYKDFSGASDHKNFSQKMSAADNRNDPAGEKILVRKGASECALGRDAAGLRQAIDRGADLEDSVPGGRTALGIASRWGFDEGVSMLLEAGADPDARQGAGAATPLVLAMRAQQDHCSGLLLAAGADPNLGDVAGWTPLLIACKQGREDWALRLVPMSNLEARARDGSSALGLAKAADLLGLASEIEGRMRAKRERETFDQALRQAPHAAYPQRI
jgi:ankyrin repeat protein